MLPKVNIQFDNGTIGAVSPSSDGVFGVLATAIETEQFKLGEVYTVKSMKDVAELEIIDTVENHRLYKFLSEFFKEGGSGNELWIMGMSKGQTLLDWFTPDEATGKIPAQKLLDQSKGRVKGLFTCYNGVVPATPVPYDWSAELLAMQSFATDYTASKYAPLFIITEWFDFNGDVIALPDLLTYPHNRVGVLIGDTEQRTIGTPSRGTAIGLLAGRLTKIQVHQNPGKVKDGPVSATKMYIVDTPPELFDVEGLNNKGYITFRTHVNKSGYYFTDDHLAVELKDDYHFLTRRRVIDKMYRIAYSELLEELLDEIPVTDEGKISPIYARTLEGKIEDAIAVAMTAKGELSFNPSNKDDKGVIVKVNTENDFLATSTVELVMRGRPHGYARLIDVLLGYQTKNTTDVNI
ncbi:DUF2586 family protein [Aquimarina algiphila]|uniref:DUF2586 family protein n=1 Tax=Aquimarina algiphila TaxID=2047982 RepID=UPI00232C0F06|nr:DUF2586 family protein [Aquimarina algiphila]